MCESSPSYYNHTHTHIITWLYIYFLIDDDTPHGFPEEILSLTNLEYLSLEYQAIVSLPAEIENLKKLTVLSLSHNPNLLSVPAQAGKLPLKRKCQTNTARKNSYSVITGQLFSQSLVIRSVGRSVFQSVNQSVCHSCIRACIYSFIKY